MRRVGTFTMPPGGRSVSRQPGASATSKAELEIISRGKGEQFTYAFDDIGNRTQTQAGGDEHGWNLRTASYSANDLNQYTSRTVPGAVDVIGVATNTATVTVNDHRG